MSTVFSAQPKEAIRCIVTNRTDRAVEIADCFDGRQIALIDPSHRWPLRLWDRSRDRPDPQMVVIEAGPRVLVWDWRAMPAPPPSPVCVGHDGGLVDKVVFRVELTVDDAVIASNEVVLKVER